MADIRLTADASDLNAALASAERSLDGLTGALGQAGRAADTADDKIGRVGKKSKSASSDVDLMEASMGRAARGAELFGLTAETAVSKLFEFGAAIVDTIRSIEDLEAEMDRATQIVFKEQLEAIKKTKEELDDFDTAWTRMKLNVAASETTQAIIGTFTTTLRDLNSATEEFGLLGGIWATVFGNPTQVDDEIQRLLAVKQAAKEAASATGGGPPVAGAPTAGPARRPSLRREKAEEPPEIQNAKDIAAAYKSAYDDIGTTIVETMVVGKGAQDAFVVQAEESAFRAQEAYATQMMNVSDTFGMMSDVVGTVGDAVVDGIKSGGKESKKALRQAAKAAKIFAIFDIQLKGLQSVMASAALGYPQAIPGIIASGVMTTVSTAMAIATPLPSFHTGGLRARGADEQVTPGAITRRGEVPAVITEQGFRSLGGEQGLAALNRGQPQGGVMAPIYLVLEGVTAPLRELARPEPALGQS